MKLLVVAVWPQAIGSMRSETSAACLARSRSSRTHRCRRGSAAPLTRALIFSQASGLFPNGCAHVRLGTLMRFDDAAADESARRSDNGWTENES